LDAASRALWTLVVGDLRNRGVLREVDGPAVARYVRAEEVARLARARMTTAAKRGEDPFTTAGSQGQRVQAPDLRTARDAERDAAAYAADLGLTPRSRAQHRLGGEPDAGADPFAAHVGDQLAARRARR